MFKCIRTENLEPFVPFCMMYNALTLIECFVWARNEHSTISSIQFLESINWWCNMHTYFFLFIFFLYKNVQNLKLILMKSQKCLLQMTESLDVVFVKSVIYYMPFSNKRQECLFQTMIKHHHYSLICVTFSHFSNEQSYSWCTHITHPPLYNIYIYVCTFA